MASTVLRHVTTAENHLLSSTKFWPLLSTVSVAVAVAVSSFSGNNFTNSTKYIFTAIVTVFHLIIFFSNPKTLKHQFAPFFPGSAIKWAIRITAMRFGYLLHLVPDRSESGLVFVICVWIDAIAIGRIIKPETNRWIVNSVLMAVVSRSIDLYGFSGRYLVVMVVCFTVNYMQVRLDGYNNKSDDETEEGRQN